MASRHQLSLDFPETANEGIFRIDDTSIYSTLIAVDCPTLEILPPGYTVPSAISVPGGFRLILNACTMGILETGCDEDCPTLADGIYHIRYSVSPNAKVYVEYNVLRTVMFWKNFAEACCKLNSVCSPDKELERDIRELMFIERFAKTAKYLVEDKNRPEDGMNMFRYAIRRLEKFTCTSC